MKILEGMSIEQARREAERPTPQPMAGTWRLVAPDGREWTGDKPFACVIREANERIPPLTQLARIRLSVEEPDPEERRIAAAEQMAQALVTCVSLMPSGLPGSMYANATAQARAAHEAWENAK